jgi:ATP-dependent DNA helicase RecG
MLTGALDTLGIPAARLELLGRLGLRTLEDLLFHFPRGYEDLTQVRRIADLVAGELQTAEGEIVEIAGREPSRGGSVVSIVLRDDERQYLEGVWFNQPHAGSRYRMGQRVAFSGKPRMHRDHTHNRRHWQMNNPRVQLLDGTVPAGETGIVPVYPLTEGLRTEHLRPLLRRALAAVRGHLDDALPPALRERHHFPEMWDALQQIHFPATFEDAKLARRRFAYEELLLLQLALALKRRELRDRQRGPTLVVTPAIDERIRRLFPFTLTQDQDRAVAEICRDLARPRPMQRLLQADVGAGKTAVALYAMLVAVACKHQAALMVPTEVLAAQHHRTLERALSQSRVRRQLLTGAMTSTQRQYALERLRAGEIDLVVGTQALAQADVCFARLGLVVIDEQHKFGVSQRAAMRQSDSTGDTDPHYLVMTATPIPRTVALTVFGDLDVTVMRQAPPGRQPVLTRWVPASQREQTYERVRLRLREGRQGYVICPLVQESDRLSLRSASEVYEELRTGPFRDFRVGLLHGRLGDEARQSVMSDFVAGQIDLLVATSVVEVGVDVANATVMLIEDADRFGLSQLHQFRGRVSRGDSPGECSLFAEDVTDDAAERLRIFVRTTDGFRLAEQDARLRGTGELAGTRQHGVSELRFADPVAEPELLHLARKEAFALVADDATLGRPEHLTLGRAVRARYGEMLAAAAAG